MSNKKIIKNEMHDGDEKKKERLAIAGVGSLPVVRLFDTNNRIKNIIF